MTANRYTLSGKQYAPDMELARERCPSCGQSHMVNYRVVEVTEDTGNGEFNWTTPENEGKLRIIMTSAPDNSSGRESVVYAQTTAAAAAPTQTWAEYRRAVADTERQRVPAPSPVVWEEEPSYYQTLDVDAPEPGTWSVSNISALARELVQSEFTATPYNSPTGESNEAGIGTEDSVGSLDGSTLGHRMDAYVRSFSGNLRPIGRR